MLKTAWPDGTARVESDAIVVDLEDNVLASLGQGDGHGGRLRMLSAVAETLDCDEIQGHLKVGRPPAPGRPRGGLEDYVKGQLSREGPDRRRDAVVGENARANAAGEILEG